MHTVWKQKRKRESLFLFFVHAISQHPFFFFFCSNRLLLQNGGFAPNLWTEVNSKRAHFFPLDAQNFCALYKKMGDVKCPLFVSTFWKRSKNTLGSFAVVVLWSFEAISINIRHEQSMTTTPRGAWNGRYFGTAFLNKFDNKENDPSSFLNLAMESPAGPFFVNCQSFA